MKQLVKSLLRTELRAEGGELFESFVENIHNKKVTIHGLEQLCTVLNVDDQNTDTLCTFVVNDQFVVMSKVNKVLKILRDAENWPDENMWIAPLGLYHEKWQVLGRPADQYQILIIGSHNFNVLAIEAITEMNELNKEMIYRHCVLMDDAWPVVSTVDLDLIVVEREIVINMGLKEFQDISKRWRQELAFRGAIFKSPANISLASVELGTLMYDSCK
ncbi:uncharacterized protein LOC133722437 [Rosa rugosa]|uniref:uncharacterized protein LOC133722437 n=1 Tax=Rosa rugosa TaxID=74645 RepID=UPI002B400D19|nr:uncharacterized protein LOC133722437 [Rosa rugosa]